MVLCFITDDMISDLSSVYAEIIDRDEKEIDNGQVGIRARLIRNEPQVTVKLECFSIDETEDRAVFASMDISGDLLNGITVRQFVDRGELTLNLADRCLKFAVYCPAKGGLSNDHNKPDLKNRFVLMSQTPVFSDYNKTDRQEIKSLVLPEMSIPSSAFTNVKIDELRAFGTAGLKTLDGHRGSYTFLAIVNPKNNQGVVSGWLTCHKGSGILFSGKGDDVATLTPQIDYGRLVLTGGQDFVPETLAVGWFADARTGLEQYAELLADWNHVKIKPPPTGYCTWYSDQHNGAGDEKSTAEFAEIAREKLVPYGMSYFQIDDKWQSGDSKNGPNKNFTAVRPDGPYPSGLRQTADLLNANGLTCGLWFMPFSGNYDDPYFADKQDLFIKSGIDYPPAGEKNTRTYPTIDQKKNAPYETFWGGTCLDMTNPKARGYVAEVTRRISRDWNCRYFKIDGLWTGAGVEQLYVNDEYKPDDIGEQIFFDSAKTNMEAYRLGMKTVREAAGDDVFILGCNLSQNMRVLLGSIGYVDAMRIGPDNGSDWNGICAGPWRGTNRYFLNGRVWWNDPDPVYVRDSIPLSHAQVIASWVALTGQLYAFSDWLPGLSGERVDVLRKTMPNHQLTSVRPVDLFTSDLAKVWVLDNLSVNTENENIRYVVGVFNWNEKEDADFEFSPAELGLTTNESGETWLDEFVVYDFWNERFIGNFGSNAIQKNLKLTIPGGSCKILAVRPYAGHPMLLSTSRNITQGIYEVIDEKWDKDAQTLTLSIDPKKAALGQKSSYELRLCAPEGFELSSVMMTDHQGNTLKKLDVIPGDPKEDVMPEQPLQCDSIQISTNVKNDVGLTINQQVVRLETWNDTQLSKSKDPLYLIFIYQ